MKLLMRIAKLCGFVLCAAFIFKMIKDHVKIKIHTQDISKQKQIQPRETFVRQQADLEEDLEVRENTTQCPELLREHILGERCSGKQLTLAELKQYPNKLAFMLVDERLKTIYCAIPKTGTTSWKTFFVRAAGAEPLAHQVEDENYMAQFGLRYLDKFAPQDIELRLQTYFKFFFVRHPLERLVSAYRDKIARFNTYGEAVQREIVEKIIKNQNVSAKEAKFTRINFDDFVQYILLKQSENVAFDHHWEHYTNICHPCAIKYDYIGKLETMDYDVENLISKFQSTRRSYMEPLNKKFSYSKRKVDNFRTFLGEFANMTKETRSKIMEVYSRDMEMFGYSFNKDSLVTSCASVVHGYNCC